MRNYTENDLHFTSFRVMDRHYLSLPEGGVTMPVYTNTPPHLRVPSRKMTLDAMENDFTYRIAQKMTRLLLDEGLISLVEYDKLVAVNSDIFYPFLHGIMR